MLGLKPADKQYLSHNIRRGENLLRAIKLKSEISLRLMLSYSARGDEADAAIKSSSDNIVLSFSVTSSE